MTKYYYHSNLRNKKNIFGLWLPRKILSWWERPGRDGQVWKQGAGNRELTLLIKSKEQREKRVRLLTPKAHLH